MKSFTWEEVEKHNKPDDAYVSLYGKVYDITEWKKIHPGGEYLLDWAAGSEITNLFESYHKISSKNYLGTEKVPCVGELSTQKFPAYTVDTGFYTKLRENVEKYFKDKGIKDTRQMSTFTIFNTFFIIGGLFLSYYFSMYSSISLIYKALFAIFAGIFHHLSMVHLLHDASHSSYSHNSSLWYYFGLFGDVFSGHSTYIWTHRHVFAHHIWTNVTGVDPDISVYKCSPHEPHDDLKYQFDDIFIFPTWLQPYMYGLVTAEMKLDDFLSYFRGGQENVKINDRGLKTSLLFFGAKILYFTHRIFLPIYLGQGVYTTLAMYTISLIVSGYLFGIFSQITHVSESCEWPHDRPIPRDWAEMQVLTATDYSHDSIFWTYISGYLNYQVPHHLLPSIAPHFYPELLPIIKKTIEEFGLKYYICDGFVDTVRQHWQHIEQFQNQRDGIFQKKKKV
eukprot:gene2028-1535_t